ncbi:hypothetical protein BKA57DRAFT_432519 [Linnemannia elongata]|nr:hypothetical protein BKA57DRAFT_432519 [Linnemannia elongata]
MRFPTLILSALVTALTLSTTTVSAMNPACEECSSANAKATSTQCATTLSDKNKDLTTSDLTCLKSLVANTAWIQSCVKPDSCTAEDVTFVVGSYTMAIQVLESSPVPDSSTSGSNGSGGAGGTSSTGSGTGASKSGGRVVGSSEMMIAIGALVAMAAAGVV